MATLSVSRREFLKKSAALGIGVAAMPLVASCTPAPPAPAAEPAKPAAPAAPAATTAPTKSAAFDWKRFKGEKIEVTFTQGNLVDVLMKNHKEFEDLTGIGRR